MTFANRHGPAGDVTARQDVLQASGKPERRAFARIMKGRASMMAVPQTAWLAHPAERQEKGGMSSG
ncbi:hypothetical protein BGC31_08855 [Komagataeibacter xylinus]|nr:hypothetical protein BGC31_08855 [Komagataeibacter xylinus]RFP07832.1 hypothetical protein BFX83_05120 [Komagataeibacter xylinus]